MKKIIISFAILVYFFGAHQARGQQANIAEDRLYYPPLVSHGAWEGVPFGYGYFNYSLWPLASVFGFSYLDYYHQGSYYSKFGAMAYSVNTKKAGVTWGHNTLNEAVDQALTFCGLEDCRLVVWVQGGCAALAVSQVQSRLGWSYADTQSRAETGALRACRSGDNGAAQCKVEEWLCSF